MDTYGGAARLNAHLQALPTQSDAPGQYTVLVVGAGLTGIEAATEMPGNCSRSWLKRKRRVLSG